MATYVAFLRAINTPPRYVKMDRIREAFIAGGFTDARTVIASGNVIFEAAPESTLRDRVQATLVAGLGFEVPVFLRTPDEIAAVATRNPFGSIPGDLSVSFLYDEPDTAAAVAVEAMATEADRIAIIGRELYWLRTVPPRDSTYSEGATSRRLGMFTTQRSMRTVQRVYDAVRRRSLDEDPIAPVYPG